MTGGAPEPLSIPMADDLRRSDPLIRLLAGRWTTSVLAQLSGTDRRYHDLLDEVDGVSPKVLTQTLRRSERDGLIVRSLDSGQIKTATVYQLTDLARSLDQPLAGLSRWVDDRWQEVEAARRVWDRRLKNT